jgi:adenosine deaminase
MYDRARAAGLRVTAHAGEDGPAQHVRDSIELLGCGRIDHGYHVVDDPELMALCRDRGIVFTVCPTTTLSTTIWRDIASPDHAIRRMVEAGLKVMINTDDSGLFRTTLDNEYALVMRNMGFDRRTMRDIVLNGIEASWLDEDTKRAWTREWGREIDEIIAGRA